MCSHFEPVSSTPDVSKHETGNQIELECKSGTIQEADPAGLLAATALPASKRNATSMKYLGAH